MQNVRTLISEMGGRRDMRFLLKCRSAIVVFGPGNWSQIAGHLLLVLVVVVVVVVGLTVLTDASLQLIY